MHHDIVIRTRIQKSGSIENVALGSDLSYFSISNKLEQLGIVT